MEGLSMQLVPRKPVEIAPPRVGPLAKLPVFLDLAGKRVVVAGGSSAAAWKAELLAAAGARVEVYAETLEPDMASCIAGAGVDNLPGGKGWRAEVERFPERSRHLYVHEGHLVELTERDRRNLAPELAGMTFSGTAAQLRERAAGLAAQGVAEIVYWPLGGDVAGELERMRAAIA